MNLGLIRNLCKKRTGGMRQLAPNIDSDKISLYKECAQLLQTLDENNEVESNLIQHFANGKSYSEHAIEELINIGAAKRGENGSLVKTDLTHSLNVRKYFINEIATIENNRRLENLSERSVRSSEKSVCAAVISAISALISALSAILK